ncbi:tripartite tricarboxylate transporter substrate binding protein [Pantoea sp. 18069]|uniref:Bug family tripartite tricarboxylate transporter substrate binding protein n=1 Tax=Pantoea sp. 18069 TaxID=2681415 RepID=UPI001358ACE7|nr:tripartite tricarboxylate transporter substrate binding protein [Pantoea sp. 18069]
MAGAQDTYPNKVVNIIVPQSASAPADALGRALAEQLGKQLGQSFVITNRDGAGGTIGVEVVKHAKADGYTLGYGTQSAFSMQPHLRKTMRYQADDFEFVCQTSSFVTVLAVGAKSRYRSLQDIIEVARKAPGTITFGSMGLGSTPHIIGEVLAKDARVKFNHIPYRNPGDLVTQLIVGDLDLTVLSSVTVANNKDIRPVAVLASNKPAVFPEVPLLKDLGYERGDVPIFVGLYAPKATPAPALARLRQACAIAVESDAFKRTSDTLGAERRYADMPAYTENIRQDIRLMKELIPELGIKPD